MDEPVSRLVGVEGIVKWFDPRKGFGFIVGPEQQDIFVHFTVIQGDGFRVLKDGTTVLYDAEKSDKGWKATRCSRVEETHVLPVVRRLLADQSADHSAGQTAAQTTAQTTAKSSDRAVQST